MILLNLLLLFIVFFVMFILGNVFSNEYRILKGFLGLQILNFFIGTFCILLQLTFTVYSSLMFLIILIIISYTYILKRQSIRFVFRYYYIFFVFASLLVGVLSKSLGDSWLYYAQTSYYITENTSFYSNSLHHSFDVYYLFVAFVSSFFCGNLFLKINLWYKVIEAFIVFTGLKYIANLFFVKPKIPYIIMVFSLIVRQVIFLPSFSQTAIFDFLFFVSPNGTLFMWTLCIPMLVYTYYYNFRKNFLFITLLLLLSFTSSIVFMYPLILILFLAKEYIKKNSRIVMVFQELLLFFPFWCWSLYIYMVDRFIEFQYEILMRVFILILLIFIFRLIYTLKNRISINQVRFISVSLTCIYLIIIGLIFRNVTDFGYVTSLLFASEEHKFSILNLPIEYIYFRKHLIFSGLIIYYFIKFDKKLEILIFLLLFFNFYVIVALNQFIGSVSMRFLSIIGFGLLALISWNNIYIKAPTMRRCLILVITLLLLFLSTDREKIIIQNFSELSNVSSYSEYKFGGPDLEEISNLEFEKSKYIKVNYSSKWQSYSYNVIKLHPELVEVESCNQDCYEVYNKNENIGSVSNIDEVYYESDNLIIMYKRG